MTTPRRIDHLIHLVRDLDAAGAAYEHLGFQVGDENRHPFGTRNRIVQFPGVFIELLAVGDHAPIPEHGPKSFSFAAFHRDRLARAGEGGSALVLASRDAKADATAYARAGIGEFDPFFFERHGRRPDGSEVHVAFELAFAEDAASPDTAFFACEHKHPENFWSAAAERHPNGATGVLGPVLTAENPSDHAAFLSTFTGVRDFRATSLGLSIPLAGGAIDVLTPDAFARRAGVSAPGGGGLRLSAIRIAAPESRVVSAQDLFGLTLLLEAAAPG
ncbi:VOC family protein [Hansschlegelia zhihuaiae]|uniref:VOC family protein n=1 Tax=Hansschlegelia zhihuaiae TaxID=405005 RepID=A0A4Q0MK70_9HYPH|nr:VOC family protein [Hansschlegelia zhihuaiae]RXF73978.1 VOC family protein [Hansschlegelia zhihuaiae]